jgi:uncharacterized membrane protein
MKIHRIFEILYLVIAVLSIVEAYSLWDIRPQKAYLFLGFAVLAVFMYFFRSHYRKKFNRRNP